MHMPELDPRTALFFDSHLEALPLYAEFLCGVRSLCPAVQEKVCKTQISLSCGRVFACASFLRVLPKAKMPPASFVLTLGLPAPLLSPPASRQRPRPIPEGGRITSSSPAGRTWTQSSFPGCARPWTLRKNNKSFSLCFQDSACTFSAFGVQ